MLYGTDLISGSPKSNCFMPRLFLLPVTLYFTFFPAEHGYAEQLIH